jgi:hypothetical protein
LKTGNFIISLCLAFICVLTFSCSKEKVDTQVKNNYVDTTKSQIITFNASYHPDDSLVAIVYWKEQGLTLNYFGERDTKGEINKINSISFYRNQYPDSVYNFTLDDSMRVQTCFRTVNQIKDGFVFKYSYLDSLIVLSYYNVDWPSNILTLREQVGININNYNISSVAQFPSNLYKNSGGSPNIFLTLATDNMLATIGVGLVIVSAGVATIPAWVGVVGCGLFITALIDVKQQPEIIFQKFEKSVEDFFGKDAGAAELAGPQNYFYVTENPNNSINFINDANDNNKEWNWCACVINYEFPIWPMTYGGSFDDYSNIANEKQVMGELGAFSCASASSPVIKSFYFLLRPASSVNFNYHVQPGCPDDSPFYKTFHFSCH